MKTRPELLKELSVCESAQRQLWDELNEAWWRGCAAEEEAAMAAMAAEEEKEEALRAQLAELDLLWCSF